MASPQSSAAIDRKSQLLEFDGCASLLELLLESFGLVLVHFLAELGGNIVDQLLGFLEVELESILDDFDDRYLLGTEVLEYYIKFGLLVGLDLTGRRSGSGDGGSSG